MKLQLLRVMVLQSCAEFPAEVGQALPSACQCQVCTGNAGNPSRIQPQHLLLLCPAWSCLQVCISRAGNKCKHSQLPGRLYLGCNLQLVNV